ncbi:cell division protein FtsL [Pontibacillus yanchengensis]|uniref:Cell division protein FtsL n=2 Tax=Pontibacillus yanchengensis TaxID=462910 RepID=A0ACC7VA58_9BACI|nr:cell division protein FtsL [Pontibacillus yanchengensis]MYL33042.1 cell division protein FtsL [Pontibacillus yanchengensis]MYL52108.1 cell division protein FtsL [Pontibacillus yanchengensis]
MSSNARKLHVEQPERNTQKQTQEQVKVHVHRKRWVSTGEKFLYSLVSAAALAASVFVVSHASTTDQLNRDLQQLENKIDKQQVENENLKYEIKELSNPERILEIAKQNGLKVRQSKVKQANTVNGN